MANAFHWLGCAMETKIAPMDPMKHHAVSIALWGTTIIGICDVEFYNIIRQMGLALFKGKMHVQHIVKVVNLLL
jgi:hypothetical protein